MYKITIPAIGSFPMIDITQEEIDKIKQSKIYLHEYIAIEEKYDLLVGNYIELEKSIFGNIIKGNIKNIASISEFYDESRLLCRHLLNWLSTSKLYLDQLAANIKKIDKNIGEEIKEELIHKRKTEICFYLMDDIRNYLQHNGIPVYSGDGARSIEDESNRIILHYCTIDLDLSAFINDSRLKEKYKKLYEENKKIDIMNYISQYFEEISEIHANTRKRVNSYYEAAKENIDYWIQLYSIEYPSILNKLQKVLGIIKEDYDGIYLEFSRNTIERIDKLQKENSTYYNMRNRYFTNISKRIIEKLEFRSPT